MTNLTGTAGSFALNLALRSLLMVTDKPCTTDCTPSNDADNSQSSSLLLDKETQQRLQQRLLLSAEHNCTLSIQKSRVNDGEHLLISFY